MVFFDLLREPITLKRLVIVHSHRFQKTRSSVQICRPPMTMSARDERIDSDISGNDDEPCAGDGSEQRLILLQRPARFILYPGNSAPGASNESSNRLF